MPLKTSATPFTRGSFESSKHNCYRCFNCRKS
jgi:hypothetical protein